MTRPGSIRFRLMAGTAVWLTAALCLGGVFLSLSLRTSVEAAFAERLRSMLLATIAAVDVSGDGLRLARELSHPDFERLYSGWYWEVRSGTDRIASRSLWDSDLPATMTEQQGLRRVEGPRGQILRAITRTVRYPGAASPVTFVIAGPQSHVDAEVAAFDRLLILSLGVLAAVLLAAIAVQVAYGLQPLRRLDSELGEVRAGRLPRLSSGYPREIEPLAHGLNTVLDQDERRLRRARELAANLAHVLKTPLALLALEAGNDAPDARRVAEQVDRMTRAIDHHLARAAAAGSRSRIGIRSDVGAAAAGLRAMLLRIHADRSLAIDVEIPAGLTFAGEHEDLEEMLGNLMENACKWATSRVRVRGLPEPERIELCVEDDGPGVDTRDASAALHRGVRLDEAAPGTGLGLAITADLAREYGSDVELGRSELGGLRARLRLPS